MTAIGSHFFLHLTYKCLAIGGNAGKTLGQMLYAKYYPQVSVISVLKAEMSDDVAVRPDGVGPQGRRKAGLPS